MKDFSYFTKCIKCNSCCGANDFIEESVAEGAVFNREKMLDAVLNLKNRGFEVTLFVNAMLDNDIEGTKTALDGFLEERDEIVKSHSYLNNSDDEKKAHMCIFYNLDEKYCTIHPSVLGEDIRGGVCGYAYCFDEKSASEDIYYSIKENDLFNVLVAKGHMFGPVELGIVGSVTYLIEDNALVIKRVFVNELYRSKGIGSNLVRAVEVKAKDNGCDKVIFSETKNEFFEKISYIRKNNHFEKKLQYLCPKILDGE